MHDTNNMLEDHGRQRADLTSFILASFGSRAGCSTKLEHPKRHSMLLTQLYDGGRCIQPIRKSFVDAMKSLNGADILTPNLNEVTLTVFHTLVRDLTG